MFLFTVMWYQYLMLTAKSTLRQAILLATPLKPLLVFRHQIEKWCSLLEGCFDLLFSMNGKYQKADLVKTITPALGIGRTLINDNRYMVPL